jgi:hypothetical protein
MSDISTFLGHPLVVDIVNTERVFSHRWSPLLTSNGMLEAAIPMYEI